MWKKMLVPVLNICAFYKQELQTVWSCLLIFCVQSRIKQQKYLKTLTYQRLSRHTPFSTFNFMCKICVYIKYLSLCINIIKTNFTVMYLFGCQYINKLARKNVEIFVVCYIRIAYEYWHSLRFYELPSAARHRFHIS